jgi:hypothetical protein
MRLSKVPEKNRLTYRAKDFSDIKFLAELDQKGCDLPS